MIQKLKLALLSGLLLPAMIFASGAAWGQKGGNFNYNLGGEPNTLHPITSADAYGSTVQGYILEGMLTHSSIDYSWEPRLAEKWEVSKDGKVFTFYLRKDAFFHDGKPVTAEDVKFSFDAIFDPAYQATHIIPYFEGIAKVEIVDPYTVKFYTKDTYFQNFETAATMAVIPKHIYGDVAKSKKMNKEIIGTGPYVLHKYDKGNRIVLKRFDKWYGVNLPATKDQYNFETITIRFVKEENVTLEMLKKGDLDYGDLTAEQFMVKAVGDPWGKTVKTYEVENLVPKSYGFVGMNLKNPLFQDRNVRLALAHLFNREEMIKKFLYGKSVPAVGPVYYKSEYASPKMKAIPFDPKKAGELLAKAGWKDTDKNGVLDKVIDGQKVEFKFSLLHSNKDAEKYFTIFKEDLKKAGIELEIKLLEWNAFMKAVDDSKFETIAMAWRPAFDWDPKQIWHSSSAVVGGSNFISYKNPKVDKLIDEARLEIDRTKRIKMLQQVAEMVADDSPYLFMFNAKYNFYAANSRIKRPVDTYKYAIGRDYWSVAP